jgi:hypothetical protein
MFDVGKRLAGWCQAAGNLTPHPWARTIALAQRRLSRSHVLQLHIRRVQHGFRAPARFLQQFRQLRISDMSVGISFQN